MIRHLFSVDVEEAFHSTALGDRITPAEWDAIPRRSPRVIEWLLRLLEDTDQRITFFVVGWLAVREPAMVRSIAAAGHEIAGHTMLHRRVRELRLETFRESIRESKDVLEQLTGQEVVGFRAPSFSILAGDEWAYDVLLEEGYRYDSSVFPFSGHPDYGVPDAPLDPYWIERPGGRLAQFPMATLTVLGRRLPAAGGAYLRFFPRRLVMGALRQAASRAAPGTLYIHPWDLDPTQPRLTVPLILRLRLYGGARAARRRVRRLIQDVPLQPIRDALEDLAGAKTDQGSLNTPS